MHQTKYSVIKHSTTKFGITLAKEITRILLKALFLTFLMELRLLEIYAPLHVMQSLRRPAYRGVLRWAI